MSEPKITHVSIGVSYYPHLQCAKYDAWVHRKNDVKNYADISSFSVKRMTRLMERIVRLFPAKELEEEF